MQNYSQQFNKKKYIYSFNNQEQFQEYSTNLLGNKGFNLCNLVFDGYNVPAGFILSAELVDYFINHKQYPDSFISELQDHLKKLEIITKKTIGDKNNPLLLSIRSSGNISLPGILDTMLNIGINTHVKNNWQVNQDFINDIFAKNPCKQYEDIFEQITHGIQLVVDSLHGEKIHKYFPNNRPDISMAIIIQEMVFGNKNNNSYTGVVFSSHPNDGNLKLFGEFLQAQQGDNLVSGKVSPRNIDELIQINKILYDEINTICKKLEQKYKYIQDVEFTVEDNKLYILQTRNAEMSLNGKILMLERFIKDKIIDYKDFFKHIQHISKITNSFINYKNLDNISILGEGLKATNNVVMGAVATSYQEVLKLHNNNIPVVFFATETTPDDMDSLNIVKGLVTAKGGATSHAAVVARGKNIVCVLSVRDMHITKDGVTIKNKTLYNGDYVTVDGNEGLIIDGNIPIEKQNNIYEFLNWRLSPIKIRMNGETPEDMVNGHKFNMDGVGLCRIEHMLLKEPGLQYIRNLLTTNTESNQKILENYLQNEFLLIFQALKDLPINIRLLDPPLHEFLPKAELAEHNPMMGNRGARILITYENLCELQIRSIFMSNFILMPKPIPLEIMVPFVFDVKEFIYISHIIRNVVENMEKEFDKKMTYKLGVMIELPRAVFVADQFAPYVDFICFGTNDLTQMTFGLSRDDSSIIIQEYIKKGILSSDPFVSLDKVVQELISLCITKAQSTNPNMDFGICGEHAGEAISLEFLSTLPLKYISCSPFRIQEANFYLNKYFILKK